MGDYRLSAKADSDIVDILAVSLERWGPEASRRYSEMLNRAMRQIADQPNAHMTRARSDLAAGLKSFHTRFTRRVIVKSPVHVIFYRVLGPNSIEIVRGLHERMDLRRHLVPE